MGPTTKLLDYVKVYDDTLDPKLCEDLIIEFEDDCVNQVSAGKDIPISKTEDGVELWKSFDEIDFAVARDWHKKYGEYLKEKVISYSQRYFDDINYPTHLRASRMGYEGFRIKRYLPNTNDRIDDHTDSNNIGTCRRFLSLFWYLNDVDDGGTTKFTELDYYVKPKRGRLLIFPPMWMFPHAGTPVISEPKYLLHSYLHFTKDSDDFNVLTDLHPLKSGAVKKDK